MKLFVVLFGYELDNLKFILFIYHIPALSDAPYMFALILQTPVFNNDPAHTRIVK